MQDYGLHTKGPKGADINLGVQHVGFEKLLSYLSVACHLKIMYCIRHGLPVVSASNIQRRVASPGSVRTAAPLLRKASTHISSLTASNSSVIAFAAPATEMFLGV